MAKPLGIPLGIDFASIDRDLNNVATRIENTGKKIKLGVDLGDMGAAGVNFGDLGGQISTGIATGIRSASATMLQFAGRVDSMLNRLSGAAITTFQRIDAAIKFPAFDAFLRGSAARLGSWAALWSKPLSDVDLAMEGAFGGIIKNIVRVFKEMLSSLAATITEGLSTPINNIAMIFETKLVAAVDKLAVEFGKVNSLVQTTEANAVMFLATVEKTVTAANRFPMGSKGLATSIPGPRIGTGTKFTGPAPDAAATAAAKAIPAALAPAVSIWREIGAATRNASKEMYIAASIPVRIGAAFVAMGLSAYDAFRRTKNILSSVGSVTGSLYKTTLKFATLGVMGGADSNMLGFKKSTDMASTAVGRLTGHVTQLGTAILAAFGVVGVVYKTVQYLIGGVKAASDLNTAVERSKIVFGSSFGVVEEQAKRNNEQFRISKQEQLDMAAGFGAIAQGAGMSEQASAGFANQMTTMAADLAASGAAESFTAAGDAITSGLTGRGMELKQLGAVMDEDSVKAYSLAKGYRAAGEEMGRQATLQTRAELVMRGLTFAQGALERNAGTSAEAFRRAGGGVQEFATQAGSLLLPSITTLTDAFNTLMGSVLTFFETNKAAIAAWAATIKERVEFVGVVVRNLDIVWEMTTLQFGMQVENIIRYVNTIPANFGLVTAWIGRNWTNLYSDMYSVAEAFLKNMFTNWQELGRAIGEFMVSGKFEFNFTPLLQGFKAATEALPEMIKPALVNVDGQMKELGDKMAAREAERLAGMKEPGAIPGKPGALPELEKGKKGADYKLASAVEFNSKEAASVIARSQTAGLGKDKATEQIKVAKDGNETLRSIDNKLGAGSVKLAIK